jgi:type VI secretion system lysozyme-like protein
MARKPSHGNPRAALLDKLVDYNPQLSREPRPLRTLSRRELRESVRRELDRLLNTRCPLPTEVREERERSVIDYGVPDFSALNPLSPDDQELLALQLKHTIETYEPRLQDVRITAEPPKTDFHKSLLFRIDAVLSVESIREPVSFPVIFENLDEGAKVDAV